MSYIINNIKANKSVINIMTTNKKSAWQAALLRYGIVTLIVAVLLPLAFKLFSWSVTWRVGIVFCIIDPIVALWIGLDMGKHQQKWYMMLILPIVFTIMVVIFYAPYNLWFGLIYLILTYLGMGVHSSIYKQAN